MSEESATAKSDLRDLNTGSAGIVAQRDDTIAKAESEAKKLEGFRRQVAEKLEKLSDKMTIRRRKLRK